MASLINSRWTRIPEAAIYHQFALLPVTSWGVHQVNIGGSPRYYLFGDGYAYPYSLPLEVIERLADRLNQGVRMTWYKEYNQQAIEHFEQHGVALNQAAHYWEVKGKPTSLPKPEIIPISQMTDIAPNGLKDGEWYIAVIGLFHLTGQQNGNNHHLFIDLIDLDGNRIYNHTPALHLFYEWEGMRDAEQPRPVQIDKPGTEPGANISMHWGQVLRGFHINNIATEQFRGVHIRYENDGPGNDRGHHSHYIVLQKRQWKVTTPPTPTPDPIPDPDPVPDPTPVPVPPVGALALRVKRDEVLGQPVDDEGYITLHFNLTD